MIERYFFVHIQNLSLVDNISFQLEDAPIHYKLSFRNYLDEISLKDGLQEMQNFERGMPDHHILLSLMDFSYEIILKG